MFQNDRRIRMFCGHYGSGKTEFAVNYVTKLKEEVGPDRKVVISERRQQSSKQRALLFTDLHIMPMRIYLLFRQK